MPINNGISKTNLDAIEAEAIDGSINIQNEVGQLVATRIFDQTPENPGIFVIPPVVGFPDSLIAGNYNDIEEQFCVTTIDDDGIANS